MESLTGAKLLNFGASGLTFRKPEFRLDSRSMMALWRGSELLPGGKRIFSRLAGKMAPYTGTINAQVDELEPGYARLKMADRKVVRNHLNSIHAVALVNFIEKTTGMAMVSQFPSGMRGIVVHISVDFVKKARGQLLAECHAPQIKKDSRQEYIVVADVKDSQGSIVAKGRATWLLEPAQFS